MLTPLLQFICDGCGHIISKPAYGSIEWTQNRKNKGDASGFGVIHKFWAEPPGITRICNQHSETPGITSTDLSKVLENPVANLLAHVDVGAYLESRDTWPRLDMPQFLDLIRRLSVPYYEEARKHFRRANADRFFKGMDAVEVLSAPVLMRLIRKYS